MDQRTGNFDNQSTDTHSCRTEYKNDRRPMGFWKTVLASMTGFIIAFAVMHLLVLVLIIGAFAGMVSGSGDKEVVVGDHLFLKIDLSQAIVERQPEKMASLFGGIESTGLSDIIRAVDHAADDPRVAGVYLYCDASGVIGWAQCDELRDALTRFRERSGKPVVAYGTVYAQNHYYLASICDRVALHPSGMVDFRGIGAEVLFYKDLLDKLDVRIDLIRPQSNAYKSAGEPYISNHMSEANREQIRSYINDIWQYAVEGIAAGRNISADSLNRMADNLTAYLAADAMHSRLVDTLLFENDIRTILKERYDCHRIVDAVRYAHSLKPEWAENRIALVYAEGEVLDGSSKGLSTAVYGDDLVDALHKACSDDKVKAIVLRINSPGGSATASEAITHAVIESREKKPVIVSMSTLAASAGYEMASNATLIVAEPTTLTGSIGVFATIPEIGGLLRNRLGINSDTVTTNRNATSLSMMRPLSPTARAMMQQHVEEFYRTFCQRVADGRGMTADSVDLIARGRVWTGRQAVANGLVDTLGGLELALRLAAEQANIERYTTVEYPQQKDWMDQLLEMTGEHEDIVLQKRIEKIVPHYRELTQWALMAPLQARLPYIIDLH